MEIFKLFNESFSRAPEKLTSSKYDSEFLRKTIKEKDDEIETLRHKLTEYEQHIQQIKENEKQAQDNALNLEEVNQQLQDKLTERDKFIDELHLGRKMNYSKAELSSKHLQNLEIAFSDVHSKYEWAKKLIEELKQNETNLQKCMQSHEKTIQLLIQQYDALKRYTVHQFTEANKWINNANAEKENVVAQLKSKIKELEVTAASLEQNLKQKVLENEQLNLICDNLINKQQGYFSTGVKTK